MGVSRTGSGLGATVRALGSQIHPVFMLPALATSVLGGLLAGRAVEPTTASLHVLAVGLALYVAHLTDGYVDFYRRGEDDDHPLTRRGNRRTRAAASLAFWAAVATLGWRVGPGAVLLTAPGWVIAVAHAPQLDTNPVGATLGYPTGIALALLGGYYVQANRLPAHVVGLAAVFLVVLAGIKVVDDAQDVTYDASIRKRTVAVVLGPARARTVAFGLVGVGSAATVGLALWLPAIPATAGLASLPVVAVAVVASRANPTVATMLLIRGSYLFLAVLVAAVWFEPLA